MASIEWRTVFIKFSSIATGSTQLNPAQVANEVTTKLNCVCSTNLNDVNSNQKFGEIDELKLSGYSLEKTSNSMENNSFDSQAELKLRSQQRARQIKKAREEFLLMPTASSTANDTTNLKEQRDFAMQSKHLSGRFAMKRQKSKSDNENFLNISKPSDKRSGILKCIPFKNHSHSCPASPKL